MIQRNGNILIGVDGNGNAFSHAVTEGQPYSDMLVTLDAQQQAARDNMLAKMDYSQKLANVQGPLDVGQGPVNPIPPAKPLQKIVSDTGVVSFTPFDPPLADLVIPKTTPSQVNTAGTAITTYDMVKRLYDQAFPNG